MIMTFTIKSEVYDIYIIHRKYPKKVGDTEGVIRGRKLKKDRQSNSQDKKDKRKNKDRAA